MTSTVKRFGLCGKCGEFKVVIDNICYSCGAMHDENGHYNKPILGKKSKGGNTMAVKGGTDQGTVFKTVRMMMIKGMTVQEAITEVEGILRGKLPDDLKDKIRQECG